MAIVKPFKAYRPAKKLAAQVASLPYDVMNRNEAKQMAIGNEHSFLRVIRAEIGMNDKASPYDTTVYKRARVNFDELVANGTLQQDQQACYYIYAQSMNGQQQVGIAAVLSTVDYENDIIKKHEFTRPAKEQDRINHISTTGLHTGPVLMAYPQVPAIDAIVNQVISQKPNYDFTAADGIQHTLWVVSSIGLITQLQQLFTSEVQHIYIADGHHRAASSAKVAQALKATNPKHTGEEEYNFFLSVLFPDNQLNIIDYNRVITDLNGLSKEEFIQALANNFEVSKKNSTFKPSKPYEFGMYLNGVWYALTAKPHTYDATHPILSLDISILSKYVLEDILNIVDQRRDDRIDFVGGIRGLQELERRVDNGEMQLAFAIYPVSIQQLFAVANSGEVMPPKSTWFEPKLRSGVVTHEF